ncbi:MAG: hypothetical protein BWY85_00727 [Firmicutes bacterium ADurb.Bin506]|nr:MAG: hypothetical protein BWY85_00727 [Firmicutes bacterium ADurb.Bin506]
MSYGGSWIHNKVKDYHVLHNTAPSSCSMCERKERFDEAKATA